MARAPAKGCSAKGAQAMKSARTTRMWTAGMPETLKEAAQSRPSAQATAAHSTRLCSSVPDWRLQRRLALPHVQAHSAHEPHGSAAQAVVA